MTGATRRSEGPEDARPAAHAHRRLEDEDGQLTILLVGLIVLVLMVLALGWDASNWLIGRRALNDTADGAAIAAASEIDVGRYYATAGESVAFDRGAVRDTAVDFVTTSGIEGVKATADVDVGPDGRPRVTVAATAPANSFFVHLLGFVPPRMEARATASAERSAAG
jgi:uncharacterized membrane protein